MVGICSEKVAENERVWRVGRLGGSRQHEGSRLRVPEGPRQLEGPMIQVWEGARQPDGSRMRVFEVTRQPDRLNQGWIRGRFGHEDWQEVTHIRPFIEDAVVFKIDFFSPMRLSRQCAKISS